VDRRVVLGQFDPRNAADRIFSEPAVGGCQEITSFGTFALIRNLFWILCETMRRTVIDNLRLGLARMRFLKSYVVLRLNTKHLDRLPEYVGPLEGRLYHVWCCALATPDKNQLLTYEVVIGGTARSPDNDDSPARTHPPNRSVHDAVDRGDQDDCSKSFANRAT
jgi:hypothetical protein